MIITGIIFIVITLALIGFGFVFVNGNGERLLAGYNAMTAAEKSKYNKVDLLKNTAKLMFLLAALHGLAGVLFMFSLWAAALLSLPIGYIVLFLTGQFATGRKSEI